MDSRKRKRDTDYPRITYHAQGRTFDRLFKEESLNEMKNVVRTKLNLPASTIILLEQLRDGVPIDLEDDDDFDAFYFAAHSTSFANVKVGVQTPEKQLPSLSVEPVDLLQSPPGEDQGKPISGEREHDAERSRAGTSDASAEVHAMSATVSAKDFEPPAARSPPGKKLKPTTVISPTLIETSHTADSTRSSREQHVVTTPIMDPSRANTFPNGAGMTVSSAPEKLGKKKKKKQGEKAQGEASFNLSEPAPPESNKSKRKRKVVDAESNVFQEELAGAISQTSEMNIVATSKELPQVKEKRARKKPKKESLLAEKVRENEEASKTLSRDDIRSKTPKRQLKSTAESKRPTNQRPTQDDLDIVSRILAARRASLAKVAPELMEKDIVSPTRRQALTGPETTQPKANITPTSSATAVETSEDQTSPAINSLLPPFNPTTAIPSGSAPSSQPLSHVQNSSGPKGQGNSSHDKPREEHFGQIVSIPSLSGVPLTYDLDAIVRGPVDPAQIPLPESSEEDETEGMEQKLEDDDTDRDTRRRVADKWNGLRESSSEQDSESNGDLHLLDDNNGVGAQCPPKQPTPEQFSFRDNNQEPPHDIDTVGDAAFMGAYAADSAGLQLANETQVLEAEFSAIDGLSNTSHPQEDLLDAHSAIALAPSEKDAFVQRGKGLVKPKQVEVAIYTQGSKRGKKESATPSQHKAEAGKSKVDADGVARRTRSHQRLYTMSKLPAPILPTPERRGKVTSPNKESEPSLAGWVVLPEPSVTAEEEFMPVDQLFSSPGIQKGAGEGVLYRRQSEHRLSDPGDESEGVLANARRSNKSKSTDRYRGLSQITSQSYRRFSTPTTPARTPRLGALKEAQKDKYGRLKKLEESETDSDNSETETEPPSHIPKGRRAGTARNKKS